MKHRNLLVLFGLALPLFAISWSMTPMSSTDHPILQAIVEKFESYFKRLPQQKVYLHFDKSNYKADETVWFKAYLVNARDHKPDSSTTNLYVELINPSGYIVQNKLIRMTDGFGNGDFSFQDTVPEGVYKLRAFTNWMRNVDEDFFFEKSIYLANPDFSTYVTREELQRIKAEKRKYKKSENKFDVQFLPEGGHLLSGVENKLGFKAINELGKGIPVKGKIFDSKGNSIVEFSSSDLGIGSVAFTPAANESYAAQVDIGDEKPLKVRLPESIEMGINITVSRNKEGVAAIKMLNNFSGGQVPPNPSYFLLAHSRGKLLFTHTFDLGSPEDSYEVSTLGLPSGIVHLSLFNMFSQVVSERLIFVNNNDALNVMLEPSKPTASPREKISVKVKLTDSSGQPVRGNFSASVANAEDFGINDNIITNLLLSSDLKGKIENPKHYFTNWNREKESQLDDLMLTHGWRRCSWTKVLSDVNIPPKYEQEEGIVITGRITKEFFNIPLRDIKVTLNILNEFNDVFETRSREKGIYRFESIDYQDTISVSIEAVRSSGKRNLVIYVDSKEDTKDKEMRYQTRQDLKRHGSKGQYLPPEDPYKDDPFAEQNKRISRIHEEPSAANVIIIDEKTQNYQSVGQILEGRIPGVMVTGNKVIIRGINTFYGNTDPLFLVDGIPVDADYAMSMNPFDVERIEVLKGPETAIYGSRGANGVIAIYTKRGKFMKKGVLDFQMLGYYTPKEYYAPAFEYKADDVFEDDRRTLYWMPYVQTDSLGQGWFSFYTSDVKGPYTIQIEGLSYEGVPASAEALIEVK